MSKQAIPIALRPNMVIRVLITLLLGSFTAMGHKAAMAIEEAPYSVLQKEGHFELRQYEPYIVAETFVEGDFKEVGNVGFRRLFDYISGNNRTRQEIEMTAPVAQEAESKKIVMTAPVGQEEADGKWRITFVMPAQYSVKTLPEPIDPQVSLREEPGRLMAAIRYSGTWSETRYTERESQLKGWIEAQEFKPTGLPIFARYNAPFIPWFLRRNEVLIPVER